TADAAASHKAVALLQRHANRLSGMRQLEDCDAILVLGEDITQNAPRLALSLRQAVRSKHHEMAQAASIPKWNARAVRDIGQHSYSPLFIATPSATRLDDVATETLHLRPDAIAQLGFAVAHALDAAAPLPDGIDDALQNQAETIAAALKDARKPLI